MKGKLERKRSKLIEVSRIILMLSLSFRQNTEPMMQTTNQNHFEGFIYRMRHEKTLQGKSRGNLQSRMMKTGEQTNRHPKINAKSTSTNKLVNGGKYEVTANGTTANWRSLGG